MVSSPQSSQRSGTIKKKRQMSHLTLSLQIPNLSQELPSLVIFNHLSLITAYNRYLWIEEMTFPLFLYHFMTISWLIIGFNSLIPLNSERYGGESHLKNKSCRNLMGQGSQLLHHAPFSFGNWDIPLYTRRIIYALIEGLINVYHVPLSLVKPVSTIVSKSRHGSWPCWTYSLVSKYLGKYYFTTVISAKKCMVLWEHIYL